MNKTDIKREKIDLFSFSFISFFFFLKKKKESEPKKEEKTGANNDRKFAQKARANFGNR